MVRSTVQPSIPPGQPSRGELGEPFAQEERVDSDESAGDLESSRNRLAC